MCTCNGRFKYFWRGNEKYFNLPLAFTALTAFGLDGEIIVLSPAVVLVILFNSEEVYSVLFIKMCVCGVFIYFPINDTTAET